MRLIHRLVGYDAKTDRMKIGFDIPDHLLPDAKQIAHVHEDDADAAWSYPLSSEQARRLATLIGVPLDGDGAEFFLEAFADPVATGAAERRKASADRSKA
jgi:hypothetical protein